MTKDQGRTLAKMAKENSLQISLIIGKCKQSDAKSVGIPFTTQTTLALKLAMCDADYSIIC